VGGSVAQGDPRTGAARPDPGPLDLLPSVVVGGILLALALAAYWLPGPVRFYNQFVWQAAAFLDGRAAIPWPVGGNYFFQDVLPLRDAHGALTGYALLPFPPLPAIVLMPFVALFGLATDERVVSVALGALDVVICWWALGRLPVSRGVRLATTVFFGFGSVAWYAASLGTTWYFAHVVALAPALLAVGVALGGDRSFAADAARVADRAEDHETPPFGSRLAAAARAVAMDLWSLLRRPVSFLDRRQFVAGLLFGIACTARLTIVLGAPFFVFVGSGGSMTRRAVSAGLGAAIPIGLLLAYNVATTGQLFHPGYEYLYQLEARGYRALGYNPAWKIEDIRYLPQNLGIMLTSLPAILPNTMPGLAGGQPLCTEPGAVRGLFDVACPIAMPRDIGMSILLTSPAYLLAIPALRRLRSSRLVAGGTLAIVAIAVVNLMHFSQGWVQFGYRFSNDFVAFALPLVAIGMARRGGVTRLAVVLLAASVAVNFWGMTWGNLLGW